MLQLKILLWITPGIVLARSGYSGTMVNFKDPKVQGHLDALVRMAQSCVIKVRATPKDVRAYFTNSSPITRSGQCFAACMLEQSDVIHHGKVPNGVGKKRQASNIPVLRNTTSFVYTHYALHAYTPVSEALDSLIELQVNRELLVHLAGLVNGKNSRVVRKLNSISRLCLDSIEGMSDRCQLASTYNDCLNENMVEFAFPLDIAEEAVRKMPFHLIQPNLPQELRTAGF